jgi:hypothetical protein
MHLDPFALIRLSEKTNLPLRWATRGERAGKAHEAKGMQPLNFRHGILTTVADEPRIYVGPGWLKRVMFDLATPSCMIRGISDGREQIMREAKKRDRKG